MRIITGFNKDIPEILRTEFIELIYKARKENSSVMNVWFVPTNNKLYNILKKLPWESKGHNTHEFTAYRGNFVDSEKNIPDNISLEYFKIIT